MYEWSQCAYATSFISSHAAGLAHLHSQTPRLLHKNFKTANVLVDENFIAKVADAGLRNFLGRVDIAGPSTQVTADEIFLAPEYYSSTFLCSIQLLTHYSLSVYAYGIYKCRVREFRQFSEKSDVFSFGVFLLELLSGKEATEPSPETSQNLVEWVSLPVVITLDYAVMFMF
jgi:serine/threonine protein kinase